jgi:hypothetical protein
MENSAFFQINSLWIGDYLPQIEHICAMSMLRQGHKVRIFTYKHIHNLPAGIEQADANEIVPKADILKYGRENFRNRQMASNIFRYRMLKQNLGLWLDLDMLLLQPIKAITTPLFGLETQESINNAVLYIPPDHELLEALINFTNTPYPLPPFLPRRIRFGQWRRQLLGRPVHAADMPWGVFGPRALTYFIKKQHLVGLAAPVESFYPIRYQEAHGPLTAGWSVASRLTAKTIGIHLWSHNLREASALRPDPSSEEPVIEPGSFLAHYAMRELGLTAWAD